MARSTSNSKRTPSRMSIPEEFIEEAMNEMQRRPAVCVFCGTSTTIKVLDEHYETCDRYPIPCPYRCGQKELPRNQMKNHLLQCPLSVVVCEFSELGCNFQGLGKEVQQHKQENITHHLHLLCESHLNHKKASDIALGKLASHLKEKAAANTAAIRALEKKMSDLSQQLQYLIEETRLSKINLEKKKKENLNDLTTAKATVNQILNEGVRSINIARESVNDILSEHITRMTAGLGIGSQITKNDVQNTFE